MLAPEFPEDLAAYDSAGNYLGDIDRGAARPEAFQTPARDDNRALDIKIVQKDRTETMPGYRLVTFDEMEVDPPAKQWLICREEGMPSRLTFYRWMNGREELKNDYARARLAWADFWAEKVLEVSFDDKADIFIEDGRAVADHARVQRARLQTDNIKWLVGKYAPRTYGDKPAEDHQSKNLSITWQKIERVIIDPKHDQLSPPPPPAQITYDPGPLPARVDPEILVCLVNMIKERVPKADQRSPDAVLDEVMGVIDRALKAEYG